MLGLKLSSIGWQFGVVVAVALAVYLIGQSAGVKSEQRRLDPKVAAICEAAGSTWVEVDANGKPLPREKWGLACQKAAAELLAYKAQVLAAQTKLLQQHAHDEAQKAATDESAASRNATAVTAAKRKMESANAAVQNNRVDGGWFGRLNELGGLRDGEAGGAAGAVRKPDDTPPY